MLLKRHTRTESRAQSQRAPQHGGQGQPSAFHPQQIPDHGSRKLLKDFQTPNWWLNIDYLEDETLDDSECLKTLLNRRPSPGLKDKKSNT